MLNQSMTKLICVYGVNDGQFPESFDHYPIGADLLMVFIVTVIQYCIRTLFFRREEVLVSTAYFFLGVLVSHGLVQIL